MNKQKAKQFKRTMRHNRTRAKISGTSESPRLSVFKSNRGMYLQLIDDTKGITLVSVNAKEIKANKITKTELALEMGKSLAKKAIEKKISKVVFDKGGYKYQGRVEAVAKGAREGGLNF